MSKETLRLYVGGINGVGKTLICETLAKRHDLTYIRGSEILLQHFQFGKQTDLHALEEQAKLRIARQVIIPLLEVLDRAVFDTHFVVPTKEGRYSEQFLPEYIPLFLAIINIIAKPETVLERRKQDIPTRERNLNLDKLKADQEKSIESARIISSKYGIRLIEVSNDKSPSKAVYNIEKALDLQNDLR